MKSKYDYVASYERTYNNKRFFFFFSRSIFYTIDLFSFFYNKLIHFQIFLKQYTPVPLRFMNYIICILITRITLFGDYLTYWTVCSKIIRTRPIVSNTSSRVHPAVRRAPVVNVRPNAMTSRRFL